MLESILGKIDLHKEVLFLSRYFSVIILHQVVRSLLKRQSAVNARTQYAWTPLMLASFYGHIPIVGLLLSNSATVNTVSHALNNCAEYFIWPIILVGECCWRNGADVCNSQWSLVDCAFVTGGRQQCGRGASWHCNSTHDCSTAWCDVTNYIVIIFALLAPAQLMMVSIKVFLLFQAMKRLCDICLTKGQM